MSNGFVVAVASGKGGTGKTTVATNLARCLAGAGRKVQYLDCDVEEPNGHVFLKPQSLHKQEVAIEIPSVDLHRCTACGLCGRICQYGAIVCIKEQVLTFEQLCHSCGGCWRLCPVEAITPTPCAIGEIETGNANGIEFVAGRLRIGSARTPAMIKQVKAGIAKDRIAIIDVPPGTSCPVVEALKDSDFVLLVTEPTPFGFNDLKLAVELLRQMKLPFAVVLNRCGIADGQVEAYCTVEGIEVVMKLPDDRRIAEVYSVGRMVVQVLPQYKEQFLLLYEYLRGLKTGTR